MKIQVLDTKLGKWKTVTGMDDVPGVRIVLDSKSFSVLANGRGTALDVVKGSDDGDSLAVYPRAANAVELR